MKKTTIVFTLLLAGMSLQSCVQQSGNQSSNQSASSDTVKYLSAKPPENDSMKHEQTEIYSPVPPVVTPGKAYGAPPSDALVLFDGKSLDKWVSAQDTTQPAQWIVEKGTLTVKPGTGNIQTKQKFGDYQLHLEWKEPVEDTSEHKGQDYGNSGLFLASLGPGDAGYEIQILDSYKSKTYVNGQAGSLYKQYPPLVNACRPPGKWQSYDIIWEAPRFNPDSTVKSPATVTAFQNGVLIQNHAVLKGVTLYIGHPYYIMHGPAPIKLQDHHHKVSYRNIWVRPL